MSLYKMLLDRESENNPIRVGVIGAGQMGRGFVSQVSRIPGMVITGISDLNRENAESAVAQYLKYGSGNAADITIATNYKTVVELENVDVILDATGVPEAGARIALATLTAHKHLILLNVEADVTVGPLLGKLFKAAGLVYSGSAGDEPAVTYELFEFARCMGFTPLVLGKGKNNPLIPGANPDTCAAEATRKRMSPHMLASFVDGTKTMMEMNLLSNATGFTPDIPGMHGVSGDTGTVLQTLRLASEGGCLNRYGVVEYVHGLAPGVFVIVTSPIEPVRDELSYVSLGDGPNFLLYRPFHLASLETPLSIARAVVLGEPTISALGAPVSQTVTVTKRAINQGEPVDGIGGYCVRGFLEIHGDMLENGHVPVGLIGKNCFAKRSIGEGQFIIWDDIEIDQSTTIWNLYQLQHFAFE